MHKLLAIIIVAVLPAIGCDDAPPLPPATGSDQAAMPGSSRSTDLPTPNRQPPEQPMNSNVQDDPVTPQPPEDPTRAKFAGLVGPVPPTWQWQPPRHHFRVAQWTIPGRDGSEPAELVVTTFAEATGNTIDNNLDRWSRQFRTTDGSPSKPEVETMTIHALPITIADYRGEYLGMGGGWHKADYRMVVAIVESPKGSIFLKLLGPDATVTANASAYRNLVTNLRLDLQAP